jgi:3-oxoacyl-[acyl-carrier-protein] synthase II
VSRSVVITGYGAVHPHGVEQEAFAAAAAAGAPPSEPTLQEFKYKRWFPESSKRIKKMDMVGKYASCSALFALRHAGLEAPPEPTRAGLVTGTMFGGLEACLAFHADLVQRGADNINPVHFPNTSHNVPCGHVAITLGLHGPVTALISGLAASHEAIAAGTRTIRAGRADLMMVGGYERWVPELGSFAGGANPAEGGCFLVLEAEESAKARGATILGHLRGYGLASDTPGRCGVDGAAVGGAARAALRMADVEKPVALAPGLRGEADYDEAVEAGYRAALGGDAGELPRSSPKAVLGETYGAAGTFAVAHVLERQAAGAVPAGPVLTEGYARGGSACALLVEGT